MIYADHAATTKISETAKLAMLSAMEKDWYNPSSLYTPGQQASGTLMDCPLSWLSAKGNLFYFRRK